MNYNLTFVSYEEMMAGMLGRITNAVIRPFTYLVTPQQTETLTISTAPGARISGSSGTRTDAIAENAAN